MSYPHDEVRERVEGWLGEQEREREPIPARVPGNPAEVFILKGWKRYARKDLAEDVT